MNVFLTRFLKKIKSDRFLTNSFIFFIGSFLAGLGNYAFHFFMARMLSVEDYGGLQSLIGLFAIFSIPISALIIVLVKYTAYFKAKKQLGKVTSLFFLFTKKVLMIASGFFVIFLALNQFIADFLNLDSSVPIIILGLSFIPIFFSSINRSIIQGLEKFKSASVIAVIEVLSKVLGGVLLVGLGFGINGAIGAIALAVFISYLIAFLPLKFLLKKQKEKINTQEIFQYFFPVFLTVLFLSLIYYIDIVLVKHFMSSHIAGEYGALDLIGHIIFFLGGPIVAVMFPITVRAGAADSDPSKTFKKTFFLIILIGAATLLFYFLFPNFLIKILVGKKFLGINKFLGWFGVAMFLYSLVYLFSNYFLSIGKTKYVFVLGIGVLLEIVLISIWHKNLWQIVWAMNVTMLMTLIPLALYYLKAGK